MRWDAHGGDHAAMDDTVTSTRSADESWATWCVGPQLMLNGIVWVMLGPLWILVGNGSLGWVIVVGSCLTVVAPIAFIATMLGGCVAAAVLTGRPSGERRLRSPEGFAIGLNLALLLPYLVLLSGVGRW
jgi:hypothetical protein